MYEIVADCCHKKECTMYAFLLHSKFKSFKCSKRAPRWRPSVRSQAPSARATFARPRRTRLRCFGVSASRLLSAPYRMQTSAYAHLIPEIFQKQQLNGYREETLTVRTRDTLPGTRDATSRPIMLITKLDSGRRHSSTSSSRRTSF